MENKDILKWKDLSETNESLINQTMITSSIKKAKHIQKIKMIQYFSIIIPLLSFTILVNTSQKFVSAINDVPIINKFIDIFKYNPSIYLARNTDVYQEIDKLYQTDDYTLYVESMVVDEDQIVLYYQVTTDLTDISGGFFRPNDYWPCAANASNFEVNQLSFMTIDPDIIINLNEFSFTFELHDNLGNQIYESIDLVIKNDLSKTKKVQTINLNKEIEFHNQKITIEKIELYPLRTIIYTKEDPNNTMDIYEYQFILKTKDGEIINRIINGHSGTHIDDYREASILESPYALSDEFEIYLEKVRWIDKNESDLIFDLNIKSFENLPEYIELINVNDHNMTVRVSGNYKAAYGGLSGMYYVGKDAETIVDGDYRSFCLLIYYDDLTFIDNKATIKNDIGYMKDLNLFIEAIHAK